MTVELIISGREGAGSSGEIEGGRNGAGVDKHLHIIAGNSSVLRRYRGSLAAGSSDGGDYPAGCGSSNGSIAAGPGRSRSVVGLLTADAGGGGGQGEAVARGARRWTSASE